MKPIFQSKQIQHALLPMPKPQLIMPRPQRIHLLTGSTEDDGSDFSRAQHAWLVPGGGQLPTRHGKN